MKMCRAQGKRPDRQCRPLIAPGRKHRSTRAITLTPNVATLRLSGAPNGTYALAALHAQIANYVRLVRPCSVRLPDGQGRSRAGITRLVADPSCYGSQSRHR
jgi:hypothetical protein